MESSALKADAEKLQKTNTDDLRTAQDADDAHSTAASLAKVAELKKCVAAGEDILTNHWNRLGKTQDW